MAKITQEEQKKISEIFRDKLLNKVNIYLFTDDHDCEYCSDTEEILTQVAAQSDLIELKTYTVADEIADKMGIDRVPATVFVDDQGQDLNIHFYGIPSGYEFNTLIEDIIEISRNEPDLPEEVIAELKNIDQDILLQVFITPTCPYCPRAVRTAHQMAMVNPRIRAEMIEAIEFRELSEKYNVSGVPKTVINSGAEEQVGAVPAQTILDKILQTV